MRNIQDEATYKALVKHMIYTIRLILICSASSFLSIAMNNIGIGKENALMVFLVGVLAVTSVTRGYIYGAVASVTSVMIFNYFFTNPYYTLRISDAKDLMLLVFFLIASLISSTMTSKLQNQTAIAKLNERTARLLYEITKGFLNLTGTKNIVNTGIKYIYDYTRCQCSIKLDSEETLFTSESFTYDTNMQPSYTIPIKGLSKQIGIIGLFGTKLPVASENEMLIKTIAYQMALVLDREFIYNEREKIRIAMESERLKSTLLRSISHDLRSPLTGIIGASELVLDSYDSLDSCSVKKLVSDIKEESEWLMNSVQNILDMTRISEGKMTLNKNFEAVDDLINQAAAHVSKLSSAGRLHVSKPEDIMLVFVDGRLMVHVLVNLLDNAYKHSGEDTRISLKAYRDEDHVVFEIADNGKGIDPAVLDTLFEGFATSRKDIADGSRGVGLGLAICKAIVTAHHGTIQADNQPTGGAVFKITLPTEET